MYRKSYYNGQLGSFFMSYLGDLGSNLGLMPEGFNGFPWCLQDMTSD
jgi:hypothetical protein